MPAATRARADGVSPNSTAHRLNRAREFAVRCLYPKTGGDKFGFQMQLGRSALT